MYGWDELARELHAEQCETLTAGIDQRCQDVSDTVMWNLIEREIDAETSEQEVESVMRDVSPSC